MIIRGICNYILVFYVILGIIHDDVHILGVDFLYTVTVRSEIHGQTTSCVTIYLGLVLLVSIIAQVNGQMVPLTIIDKAQEKLASIYIKQTNLKFF